MGYSSPLWGAFLRTLFTLFPQVPWYGVLLLLVQALSMAAIAFGACQGPFPRAKSLLFVGSYLCAYFIFFADLQFTVTASLAAQGALFLGARSWRERGTREGEWGWVAFLLFVASLIRLESLVLTLLCAAPFLARVLRDRPTPPPTGIPLRTKAYALLAVGLVGSGVLYGQLWSRMGQGWEEFARFDRERVEMQDYRITRYDERTQPFFDEVGWTQNDLDLLKNWYYHDETIFSTEKLRALKRHFPRFGTEGKPASYASPWDLLTNFWAQRFLMAILCLALFCPPRALGFLVLQLLWIMGILVLMLYCLRVPDRVLMPLLALGLGTTLFLATPDALAATKAKERSERWVGWAARALLLVGLVLGARSLAGYWSYTWKVKRVQERSAIADLERLSPKPDQLFVIWDSSFPYEAFSAYDDLERFRTFRILALVAHQRTPNTRKMLDLFRLKEPLRDMVDRPDVLLICSHKEGLLYRKYMLEKHRMTIHPELHFQGGTFNVLRIHSRPPRKGTSRGSGAPPGAPSRQDG